MLASILLRAYEAVSLMVGYFDLDYQNSLVLVHENFWLISLLRDFPYESFVLYQRSTP